MKELDEVRTWRRHLDYATLLLTLILFEFIVSVIMISVGYLSGNVYFRGVGIGLLIAWVTSGIAYLVVRRAKQR